MFKLKEELKPVIHLLLQIPQPPQAQVYKYRTEEWKFTIKYLRTVLSEKKLKIFQELELNIP